MYSSPAFTMPMTTPPPAPHPAVPSNAASMAWPASMPPSLYPPHQPHYLAQALASSTQPMYSENNSKMANRQATSSSQALSAMPANPSLNFGDSMGMAKQPLYQHQQFQLAQGYQQQSGLPMQQNVSANFYNMYQQQQQQLLMQSFPTPPRTMTEAYASGYTPPAPVHMYSAKSRLGTSATGSSSFPASGSSSPVSTHLPASAIEPSKKGASRRRRVSSKPKCSPDSNSKQKSLRGKASCASTSRLRTSTSAPRSAVTGRNNVKLVAELLRRRKAILKRRQVRQVRPTTFICPALSASTLVKTAGGSLETPPRKHQATEQATTSCRSPSAGVQIDSTDTGGVHDVQQVFCHFLTEAWKAADASAVVRD